MTKCNPICHLKWTCPQAIQTRKQGLLMSTVDCSHVFTNGELIRASDEALAKWLADNAEQGGGVADPEKYIPALIEWLNRPAQQIMKQDGWKQHREDGHWVHLCPDCAEVS